MDDDGSDEIGEDNETKVIVKPKKSKKSKKKKKDDGSDEEENRVSDPVTDGLFIIIDFKV